MARPPKEPAGMIGLPSEIPMDEDITVYLNRKGGGSHIVVPIEGIRVPDVVGMTLQEGTAVILVAGLTLGTVTILNDVLDWSNP